MEVTDAMTWTLIESDPGVFTELVHRLGVENVEFREVYQMDELSECTDIPTASDDIATQKPKETIYGLIFLHKFSPSVEIEDRSSLSSNVSDCPPKLFFAKQVIQNACATQAILSVLMNNTERIQLSQSLQKIYDFSSNFDAKMKGLSISNCESIRDAHNSFSSSSLCGIDKDQNTENVGDGFHFVSLIYFGGQCYELDGLKDHPIPLGECTESDWTVVAKRRIQEKIGKLQKDDDEIRFNLLAVVNDKCNTLKERILWQRHKRQRVEIKLMSFGDNIQLEDDELSDDTCPDDVPDIDALPDGVEELKMELLENNQIISFLKSELGNEISKRQNWSIENVRRRHDFVPFVLCALRHLARQRKLENAWKNGLEMYEKRLSEEKLPKNSTAGK